MLAKQTIHVNSKIKQRSKQKGVEYFIEKMSLKELGLDYKAEDFINELDEEDDVGVL